MKKTKPILLLLCAVLLVSAAVLGTVAYLQDTDEVVNTFTVGKVHLKLDEAAVNERGEPIGGRTEDGNAYHLVPGKTYTKDPTVTVLRGSEEAYVRMLVTVSCYDELSAIFGEPFLLRYFVAGWDSSVWVATDAIVKDEVAGTAIYEFRYFDTVRAEKDADLVLDALFDAITVPSAMNGAQLAAVSDLEITVEAHAVQAAGFADADEAWSAFSK